MENHIFNYYEPMVFEEIQRYLDENHTQCDEDILFDIACLALNQLPCRYVRYRVDMAFFLGPEEAEIMEKNIKIAVEKAFSTVKQKPRNH